MKGFWFSILDAPRNPLASRRSCKIGHPPRRSSPLHIKDPPDLVGLVAVHAGGDEVWLFLPELAANDFAVYALNQRMALCARMGDVLLGN